MPYARLVCFLVILLLTIGTSAGQAPPDEPKKKDEAKKPEPLDYAPLLAKAPSEAAAVARRYDTDRGAITRVYAVPLSRTRSARLKKFDTEWLTAVKAIVPDKLTPAAREDLVALRSKIETNLKQVEDQAATDSALAPLYPFAVAIVKLDEERRRMLPMDAEAAAGRLALALKQIDPAKAAVTKSFAEHELAPGIPATKAHATKAADAVESLRTTLKGWYAYYDGYDPLFTWWMVQPNKQVDVALDGYAKFLRDKVSPKAADTGLPPAPPLVAVSGVSDVPDLADMLSHKPSELTALVSRGGGGGRFGGGRPDRPDPTRSLEALAKLDFPKLSAPAQVDYLLFKNALLIDQQRAELRDKKVERPAAPKDDTGIAGRPIGREALLIDLAAEMIPYSPEELMALAKDELAWCDAEMQKASAALGYNDWKQAVEKVKTMHVRPGEQPELIRKLAIEAIDYLQEKDLVTVTPLAIETWRMAMMSAERQQVNPFFTGGEVITVAFPTNTMSHDAKLQSLRGNNIPFARATVQHELIPGHHLQQYSNARTHPQRFGFGTPFWTEGWALYWEFVLYAKGFPKTPEDKIGFLVWRKHRCARVLFSLGYHLGTMTPRQCVDLLVDRVGFEPENATAEVRRSFGGGYSTLYQAAYLMGGMQFRALRKELVESGKMTDKAFHDAILAEGAMPVAMVRAILTKQPLTADTRLDWKFAGTPIVNR